jgi:DivIVA domain-containing protein
MSLTNADQRRLRITAQAIRAHELPPPPGWRRRAYDADAVDRYLERISDELQRLNADLTLARQDAAVKTRALHQWQSEQMQQQSNMVVYQAPVTEPEPEPGRPAVNAEAIEILSRAQRAADRMVSEAQAYGRQQADRMVTDAEHYARELARRENMDYRAAVASAREEAQRDADAAVRDYRASAEAYVAEVEDMRRFVAWMRGLSNALEGMEAHLTATRRQFDDNIDRLAIPETPRPPDLRDAPPPPRDAAPELPPVAL